MGVDGLDELLVRLYSIFNVIPALLIHPPFLTDRPIAELIDAGGYTQLGGIDVRVPLDVLRNLQMYVKPVHPSLSKGRAHFRTRLKSKNPG